MKFSVLMSVYGKENPAYLKESLDSIFHQSLMPNEVILVEDGPLSIELYSVIQLFEKTHSLLKIVRLKHNMGLGYALNYGLKMCSYEYVARMDSDDICFPDRFEKQISYLEMHPDIDVLGCWTREFTEGRNGEKVYMAMKKFPNTVWENLRFCTKRCPVEHPAVVFKKQAVIDAGNYQPVYLFEDYALWAHMFVNGAKFYNLPEPLLYFRSTTDSFRRRGGWKYAHSELRALQNFKKIGFLSNCQYIFAIVTRFPVRVMPFWLREVFYKVFLRR